MAKALIAADCNVNSTDNVRFSKYPGTCAVESQELHIDYCIHCPFPQHASTPLHLAARRGHSEVVKAIVANEAANVNAADQAHNEHNFEPYCFAGRRLTVRPVHSMPRPLPPAIVCFAAIDGKMRRSTPTCGTPARDSARTRRRTGAGRSDTAAPGGAAGGGGCRRGAPRPGRRARARIGPCRRRRRGPTLKIMNYKLCTVNYDG